LTELLATSKRIHLQQRKDKNKVYSVHEPGVECISKGNAHKRYEFGCKVSISATSKGGWLTGAKAFRGNPYDGHTLQPAVEQTQRVTGQEPEEAYSARVSAECTLISAAAARSPRAPGSG
jgi:IS5 family transposase